MTGLKRAPPAGWILAAIVVVGGGLRLLGAARGNLMYDEHMHRAAAMTIGPGPGQVPFLWHSVDHPMMSANVLRLSTALFGESNFGLRLLHVLIGTALVFAVFLLARRAFNERVGLWAAALAAVDQFLVTWSYFAVPEILLLFFATLTIWQLLGVLEDRRTVNFVLMGLFLGLSYLAKECAVFLIPVLWLSLLLDRDWRRILLDPRWYVAFLIALVVVLPDVAWNVAHRYESYFARNQSLLDSSLSLNPRVGLLFLGELRKGIAVSFDFFAVYGLQTPARVHWPAGLLYIIASGLGLLAWRHRPVRPLLAMFTFMVAFFTLLPAAGANWWWPSLAVPPAVVLTGRALERFQAWASDPERSRAGRRVAVTVVALAMLGLSGRAATAASRSGLLLPRVTADELARRALDKVEAAVTAPEIRAQDWNLTHTLHTVGPHPDLFAQLARVACFRGQAKRTEYFVRRALALDAASPVALDISRRLGTTGGCAVIE